MMLAEYDTWQNIERTLKSASIHNIYFFSDIDAWDIDNILQSEYITCKVDKHMETSEHIVMKSQQA